MLLACFLCACGGIGVRPPEVKVVEAHEVGVLPQSPLITGRDGGDSAFLWGHSVWAFGDTVLSVPDADGVTWHHNSFSASDDLDGEDGVTWLPERLDGAGAPRYLIAPTPEEEAFNAAHRGDPAPSLPAVRAGRPAGGTGLRPGSRPRLHPLRSDLRRAGGLQLPRRRPVLCRVDRLRGPARAPGGRPRAGPPEHALPAERAGLRRRRQRHRRR